MKFVWSDAKAVTNRRKHGVGFEEACSVFLDEDALLVADADHVAVDDRFVLLGMSSRLRLLVVVHAYRDHADELRLISARKANRLEAAAYAARRRRTN